MDEKIFVRRVKSFPGAGAAPHPLTPQGCPSGRGRRWPGGWPGGAGGRGGVGSVIGGAGGLSCPVAGAHKRGSDSVLDACCIYCSYARLLRCATKDRYLRGRYRLARRNPGSGSASKVLAKPWRGSGGLG